MGIETGKVVEGVIVEPTWLREKSRKAAGKLGSRGRVWGGVFCRNRERGRRGRGESSWGGWVGRGLS